MHDPVIMWTPNRFTPASFAMRNAAVTLSGWMPNFAFGPAFVTYSPTLLLP